MINTYRLEKILLNVIKAGVFFVLFSPLVMNSGFFFPFIVPRNVFFRIAVEILFFSWLILMHINPAYKPNFKKWDKLTWAIVGFFAVNVVATVFSIGQYRSFWSNYERMGGLFHFSHLLMYIIVLISVFKHKKDWHDFFSFSIFVSILMSFLGFAQYLEVPFLLASSGGKRLTGTVGNATFFASYLVFHFFFILYFLFTKARRFSIKTFAFSFLGFDLFLILASVLNSASTSDWGAWSFMKAPILSESFSHMSLFLPFLLLQGVVFATWYFRENKYAIPGLLSVILLFESFIIYNTQTRGAILGLGIGFAFLAFASLFLNIEKRLKIVSLVVLLGIILAPFALIAAKDTSFVKGSGTLNRLASISLSDITTESRFLVWNASYKGWTETPKTFLIGYGPENFYYSFNKYFPTDIYKDAGSRVWFDKAHNIIFDVAVTTGLIGLLVYLSIFVFAALSLASVYKKNGSISSSWLFVSLLVAYFVQNIFVFDTLNTDVLFYLLLGFIAVLHMGSKEDELEEDDSATKSVKVNYIYVSTVIIVLLFGIFAINIRTLNANHSIFLALTGKDGADQNNSIESRLEHFEDAINNALPGRFEARHQMSNFSIQILRREDITQNQARTIINTVEPELQKSLKEEPTNIRLPLVLANFYEASQRLDSAAPQKSIDLLKENLYLSQDRPQIYFELGQAYAVMGNIEEAHSSFEKAVSLAPTVPDARTNLIVLYVVTGAFDKASEQLEILYEIGEKDFEAGIPRDYLVRIIDAYGRVSAWEGMAELLEQLIAMDAQASDYSKVAAIYAKLGQNEKAINATVKAVEIDPSFEVEAEEFIRQLNAGELLDEKYK